MDSRLVDQDVLLSGFSVSLVREQLKERLKWYKFKPYRIENEVHKVRISWEAAHPDKERRPVKVLVNWISTVKPFEVFVSRSTNQYRAVLTLNYKGTTIGIVEVPPMVLETHPKFGLGRRLTEVMKPIIEEFSSLCVTDTPSDGSDK